MAPHTRPHVARAPAAPLPRHLRPCLAQLDDTAIFDVLLPPYNDADGRSCHYYQMEHEQEGGAAQLVEVGWPPGLRIVNRPYLGLPCGPEWSLAAPGA